MQKCNACTAGDKAGERAAKRCISNCMISTFYGTLGAATGIAQGLLRGAFKPLPVPDAVRRASGVDEQIAIELVADFVERGSVPATSVVHLLPLLVVGSCRVGKTTLVNTYLHGQPLASPEPTLGADLSSKQLTVKELNLSLQIWDTAGEDQADLLDTSFWSNASGAVIVCNLHRTDCISSLTFWQNKLHQDACGLPIVVVGVRHDHHRWAEPRLAQQHEGLAAQWCRDNESRLFIVNHPSNQASAAKAFTAVVHKALLYSEQKAKPVYKPISAAAYPSLLLAQNGCNLTK